MCASAFAHLERDARMGLVDLRRKARARRGSREVLYRKILPYRLELLTRVVVVALGGPPPLHELEGVD